MWTRLAASDEGVGFRERLPECPFNAAQRLGFSLAEVADLLQTGQHRHGHTDAGLQAHAAAKIAEIDARIDDLQVIRASLVTAMEAGCDDLMVCATTDGCPLPFTGLARP